MKPAPTCPESCYNGEEHELYSEAYKLGVASGLLRAGAALQIVTLVLELTTLALIIAGNLFDNNWYLMAAAGGCQLGSLCTYVLRSSLIKSIVRASPVL